MVESLKSLMETVIQVAQVQLKKPRKAKNLQLLFSTQQLGLGLKKKEHLNQRC